MRLFIAVFLMLFLTGCEDEESFDFSKLGQQKFSSASWKSSSQEQRGKMLSSLLSSHAFKGMRKQDVIDLLGKSTAYYEYDEFPAYFVGSKNVQSQYGSGYLLAFPIDRDTGLIREVVFDPEPQ